MIDNSNSEFYDQSMDELTFRGVDPETGEIYEQRFDPLEWMRGREGWEQRENGEGPWVRPHDPLEDAPDPRETGI